MSFSEQGGSYRLWVKETQYQHLDETTNHGFLLQHAEASHEAAHTLPAYKSLKFPVTACKNPYIHVFPKYEKLWLMQTIAD